MGSTADLIITRGAYLYGGRGWLCGGGRRNPVLLEAIRRRVAMPVTTAEDQGWRGDAIEAEAFAYLAARTLRGLPISFPGTTGVAAPITGGRIVRP